jgi:hypothetical protein
MFVQVYMAAFLAATGLIGVFDRKDTQAAMIQLFVYLPIAGRVFGWW